ncbi:MAG: hypothetical protein QM778_34355 [Myxococcales bacterium]
MRRRFVMLFVITGLSCAHQPASGLAARPQPASAERGGDVELGTATSAPGEMP